MTRPIGILIAALILLGAAAIMPAHGAGDFSTAPGRVSACGGECGDLNFSGTVTTTDLLTLSKSVSRAYLPPSLETGCADVDDYQGVNLRDVLAMAYNLFYGEPQLDCMPDQPPYVPQPSTDFVIVMNDVVPAGASVVRISPQFRPTAEFHSFSADFHMDVDGEIPKILAVSTANVPAQAGWESARIEYPSYLVQNLDSLGIIMLTFLDYDKQAGEYSNLTAYPLGYFDLQVSPAPYARKINFVLQSYFPGDPPGFNTPMMIDTNLVGWEVTSDFYAVRLTGDANNSGTITSADVIYLVNYVFKSGSSPYPVPATGDVNCTGTVTSADIIYLVAYVFLRGPYPCDVEAECTINLDQWTCP